MKKENVILPNLRAFEVKYQGATNHRGSRIKITDLRFNKSVTISCGYEYNNTFDQAAEFLLAKGIEVISKAEGKECYILLTNDFTNQIK